MDYYSNPTASRVNSAHDVMLRSRARELEQHHLAASYKTAAQSETQGASNRSFLVRMLAVLGIA